VNVSSGARVGVAVAVLVLIVALGLYLSRSMMQNPIGELDLSRSKPTAQGLYLTTITPEGGEPSVGPMHSWVVEVKTPDGRAVDGATISVDGGMPEHNHGLPTAPQVTAGLGEGRYRIEGVKFSMPGRWVLRIAVDGAQGKDEATFNLML